MDTAFFIANGDLLSKAISHAAAPEKLASNVLAYPINGKVSINIPNDSSPNFRARTRQTDIAIKAKIITANIKDTDSRRGFFI